jgi:hypothetical protein
MRQPKKQGDAPEIFEPSRLKGELITNFVTNVPFKVSDRWKSSRQQSGLFDQ